MVVAAPEQGPIADLLQARGLEVILDSSFLTDPARARLNELVRGYDLVVANTLASWPVVRASHAAGVPVIWYLHETLVAFDLIRKIPAIEPTFALADLLITPTRQTARIYQDIARTKVEVVPYGIPEAAAIAATKRTTNAVSFVALGSYEPRKGQDILVEAIARLAPEVRSRGRFTMAGRVLDSVLLRETASGRCRFGKRRTRRRARSRGFAAAPGGFRCAHLSVARRDDADFDHRSDVAREDGDQRERRRSFGMAA